MEVATVFLPFIGAVLAGFFGRIIGDRAAYWLTSILLCLSALLSCVLFYKVGIKGEPRTVELLQWLNSGTLEFSWSLKIDALSSVMLVVVTVVSAVVHIYSVGYMAQDKSISRFFAYLSLFTFFMLILVTADNLIQLFFGWEGVGLCSYLLIGFWFERPSANKAAIKAFVVNRIGDFGFALGIFAIFFLFESVQFTTIFSNVDTQTETYFNIFGTDYHALTVVCMLLFVGAMGKSAQLGLHTWLPDAMEGPTPVSALIHAATMVTAGVFMVCRMSPLFEYSEFALAFIAIVGGITAFVTASIGLTQNDIKRVIAYSTCSQLGYMFFAIGVSAYPAAIFHLMTHGFFKALLFLGAGSIIHAFSGEQDMRKMGGVWKLIPITYIYMWIGTLSLVGIGIPGVFGMAGFYSKDVIIESAWASGTSVGTFAFWAGLAAAFMTAFYSCRLIFMTFHGKAQFDDNTFKNIHESPKTMLFPLAILALGAIFLGTFTANMFIGSGMSSFWADSLLILPSHDALKASHHVPLIVKLSPLIVAVLGILLAWQMYILNPISPTKWAKKLNPLYNLSLNKWYFDEIYNAILIRPVFFIARGLWKSVDGNIIDGIGPDGIAETTRRFSLRISRLQSGYLYHYAFAMLIGVVLLVTWYFYSMMFA